MTTVRQWTGAEAKALRAALRLTVQGFAEGLGVNPRTVAKWEARGSDITPTPEWQAALDTVLAKASADDRDRFRQLRTEDSGSSATAASRDVNALTESVALILERLQSHDVAQVDDAVLAALDLCIADVAMRYEDSGPMAAATVLVRQRQWADAQLAKTRPSRKSLRLTQIAARLSAMLSYTAVNLGDFGAARAYALEAFTLAGHMEDRDLQAWVRGTQSFAEYYAGNYDRALWCAEDGLRYAGDSPQAVRLLINGVARAHGKLQQRKEVDYAVGRAYDLLGTFAAEPGMSPCISLGPYSEARVASNAATAYLSLRDTDNVLRHAERALVVVDASPSVWSQAPVRLDTATALLLPEDPDIEQATALTRRAMTVSGGRHVESIRQRTEDLADAMSPWTGRVGDATHLVEEIRGWLGDHLDARGR